MGLADLVFPAFLFAVGMSVPVALHARLRQGDARSALLRHVGWRAAYLILIGVFMVNMESGYNEMAMGMPMAAWSLAVYGAVVLVWGNWPWPRAARAAKHRPADRAGGAVPQRRRARVDEHPVVGHSRLHRLGLPGRQPDLSAGAGAAAAAGGRHRRLRRPVRLQRRLRCPARERHARDPYVDRAGGVLCTLLLFDLGTAHPAPVRLGRAALLALSLAGAARCCTRSGRCPRSAARRHGPCTARLCARWPSPCCTG
ncbi:DUF5009 domain-containing protein [Massilia sp. B-10]|nr:DUF5009 domain-containing protein [Massilia sp. B-10]